MRSLAVILDSLYYLSLKVIFINALIIFWEFIKILLAPHHGQEVDSPVPNFSDSNIVQDQDHGDLYTLRPCITISTRGNANLSGEIHLSLGYSIVQGVLIVTQQQWGIFSDDSADYTEEEAIEAGFYSKGDADYAVKSRYSEEDGVEVHLVEESDDSDENDDNEV